MPFSNDPLEKYRAKRDFRQTAEPSGGEQTSKPKARSKLAFVIQKHAASHLHYDLRLELDGVMKSWAVPKGPSLDPDTKRLAMQVEDHPIEYNKFEGTIPKGQYGGGTVMLWDRGTYSPDEINDREDMSAAVRRGLSSGKLAFTFHGKRLLGSYALVRTRRDGRPQWLLIKHRDEHAIDNVGNTNRDITETVKTSVASGRTMEQIAAGDSEVWQSNRLAPDLAQMLDSFQGENAVMPMMPSKSGKITYAEDWAIEPWYEGTRVFAFAASGTGRILVPGTDSSEASVSDGLQRAITAVARRHEGPIVFDAIIHNIAEDDSEELIVVDMLVAENGLLIDEPWIERRTRLETIISELPTSGDTKVIRTSEWVLAVDRDALETTGDLVAKRIDSIYQPGVSREWLKVKT
jgi:bifunctional non-homologous end joining protein LigD